MNKFWFVFAILAIACTANAQNMRLVTPWAVGGGSDHVTRVLADMVQNRTAINVMVENRSGANGVLAGREVALSGPDRNIYLSDSMHMLTNSWLVPGGIGYDPRQDLVPVASLARQHHVLVVSANLPVHSASDLIALAKKHNGSITFGHSGLGASHHMVALILQNQGRFKFNEIGYRTTLAALTAVASGEIAVASGNVTAATPLLRTGRLRAIAKLSPDTVLPVDYAVPLGTDSVSGLQSSSHEILWASSSQSNATIRMIQKIVIQIVASPEFSQRLAKASVTAVPMGSQELDQLIESRMKHWREILSPYIKN